MNILDYIEWRGDLTFGQKSFNEVDNLVFSVLAYLKMDGLVPPDGITIAELYERSKDAGLRPTSLTNDPLPLITKAACCERFKDVIVKAYVNMVDAEKQLQFSAVTFIYDAKEAYIAFRGTDNTLVGWREDLNLSFLSETPGQYEAAAYLSRAAGSFGGDLYVGGHSKGGNFAVYAAAFCDAAAREKIIKVYSNDGPGFNKNVASKENFTAVVDRVEKIIPESSLVGVLLSGRANRKIIKSSAKRAMQHDPFSWQVVRDHFEEVEMRSDSSVILDETLNSWADSLSDKDLRMLGDTVFGVLESTGATTLREIKANKASAYPAILKAVSQLDTDAKSEMLEMMRKLLASGRNSVVSEIQKKQEKMAEEQYEKLQNNY